MVQLADNDIDDRPWPDQTPPGGSAGQPSTPLTRPWTFHNETPTWNALLNPHGTSSPSISSSSILLTSVSTGSQTATSQQSQVSGTTHSSSRTSFTEALPESTQFVGGTEDQPLWSAAASSTQHAGLLTPGPQAISEQAVSPAATSTPESRSHTFIAAETVVEHDSSGRPFLTLTATVTAIVEATTLDLNSAMSAALSSQRASVERTMRGADTVTLNTVQVVTSTLLPPGFDGTLAPTTVHLGPTQPTTQEDSSTLRTSFTNANIGLVSSMSSSASPTNGGSNSTAGNKMPGMTADIRTHNTRMLVGPIVGPIVVALLLLGVLTWTWYRYCWPFALGSAAKRKNKSNANDEANTDQEKLTPNPSAKPGDIVPVVYEDDIETRRMRFSEPPPPPKIDVPLPGDDVSQRGRKKQDWTLEDERYYHRWLEGP